MTTNTATKTATITPITAEFTPSSVTIEGITYPATYTVEESGEIHILLTVSGDPVNLYRVTINPCEASYPAALAAAKPCRRTTKAAAAPASESSATVSPAADTQQAAPAAQDAPAAPVDKPIDPAKQAHGPVPEKTFAGTAITGRGWRIVFDDAAKRTRVYLTTSAPWADDAKKAIEAAGFFWAPSSGAWQKKLTFRAYRAARELAAVLAKLAK